MKTLGICSGLLLLFLPAAWAQLGPSTGGGGFVVSCPATPVSKASVELLDLYEARESLRFRLVPDTGDLQENYWQAADRIYTIQGHPDLAETNRESILLNLHHLFLSLRFVSNENELPPATDLGIAPHIPPLCSLKQVAYFNDQRQEIFVLKSLWDQMRPLDQTALLNHELWGREMRRLGEVTSQNARRVVAHIYADQGYLPLNDGIVPGVSKSYYATAVTGQISSFYATKMYSLNRELLRLQFTQLASRPQMSKTWIDLPYNEWNLIPSGKICVLQTPGIDVRTRVQVQGTFTSDLEIEYELRTGMPVKLTLFSAGRNLGSAEVDGGTRCRGI